jgi:hypothetical protein
MIAERGPRVSIQRPISGPDAPETMNEIENPSETSVRDQPNSDSSGPMYSPNAQNETPLPTAIAATEAARIHQPRKGSRGGAVLGTEAGSVGGDVTRGSS